MYFDSIAILCDPPQHFIATIDLYPPDLGVWHSQRLCQMLDGLLFPKINRDLPVSLIPA